MLTIKVKSSGLTERCRKSITYINNTGGKVVENILRNIVTGEGHEEMRAIDGMHQKALSNAPTASKIETDVKRLSRAFVAEGKGKTLKRLTPEMREALIKKRQQTIGHTGRALEYKNWAPAIRSRASEVINAITGKIKVELKTKGTKPSALFHSKQGGVSTFQKRLGIATESIAKAQSSINDYVTKTFTRDLRKIFK